MPKVHYAHIRPACDPYQVKEHKKLVSRLLSKVATSFGIIGKSCHMYLKKEKSAPKSSEMSNLKMLCVLYLKFDFKFEFFMKLWYRGHCPRHLYSVLWPYMMLIEELTEKGRKWHIQSKTLFYAQDYWLICS